MNLEVSGSNICDIIYLKVSDEKITNTKGYPVAGDSDAKLVIDFAAHGGVVGVELMFWGVTDFLDKRVRSQKKAKPLAKRTSRSPKRPLNQ